MRWVWLAWGMVGGVLLAAPAQAQNTCTEEAIPTFALDCTTPDTRWPVSVAISDPDETTDYSACLPDNHPGTQVGPERYIEFTCSADTVVHIDFRTPECDADVFVLDDTVVVRAVGGRSGE